MKRVIVYSLRIRKETHQSLKELAKEKGIPISQYTRKVLAGWVEFQKKKEKKKKEEKENVYEG
jgi:predicted DNA-binding protein